MTRRPMTRRQAILGLAAAETLLWAGTFYVFAALIARWEAATGWTKAELAFAFTLALICSAAAAPFAGRLIDAGRGPLMMGLSGALAGALMAALALAESPFAFTLIWAAVGVAMAGCLYEPCFAIVTRALGTEARRAITHITLVAGFASTLTFPGANLVAEAGGWRAAVVACGAVAALIGAPLAYVSARALGEPDGPPEPPPPGPRRSPFRRPAFWLIALAFSTTALNHGMLLAHLLPILHDRGAGAATAVLAASLIGPMQVAGRLALMAAGAAVPPLFAASLSFLGVGAAALALAWAGVEPTLIWVFVVLQGGAYGLTSILRPVVLAELVGRNGFGVISGLVSVPYVLSFAAAPYLGAALWGAGGYDLVIRAAFGLAVAGLAALIAAALAARP